MGKKDADLEEKALAVLALDPGDDAPDDAPLDPDAVLDADGNEIPDEWQFTSKGKVEKREVKSFALDGMRLTAVKPLPMVWAFLLGSLSNAATKADKTKAILDFLQATLTEPSWMLLLEEMKTNPRFEPDTFGEITDKLIRHWAPSNRAERRARQKR